MVSIVVAGERQAKLRHLISVWQWAESEERPGTTDHEDRLRQGGNNCTSAILNFYSQSLSYAFLTVPAMSTLLLARNSGYSRLSKPRGSALSLQVLEYPSSPSRSLKAATY